MAMTDKNPPATRKLDPEEPIYVLMNGIIEEINDRIRVWKVTGGMSKHEIDTSIASALMAESVHYHGNVWGCTKEQFLQMAEEFWEMRVTPNSYGGVQ